MAAEQVEARGTIAPRSICGTRGLSLPKKAIRLVALLKILDRCLDCFNFFRAKMPLSPAALFKNSAWKSTNAKRNYTSELIMIFSWLDTHTLKSTGGSSNHVFSKIFYVSNFLLPIIIIYLLKIKCNIKVLPWHFFPSALY